MILATAITFVSLLILSVLGAALFGGRLAEVRQSVHYNLAAARSEERRHQIDKVILQRTEESARARTAQRLRSAAKRNELYDWADDYARLQNETYFNIPRGGV